MKNIWVKLKEGGRGWLEFRLNLKTLNLIFFVSLFLPLSHIFKVKFQLKFKYLFSY
jgi:hypothetical protein